KPWFHKMEKIKLTFLGTGSSIPTARRNHPAMLISYKDENILVDCGEGTQRQFRYARLNPCKITKILITHWHADHVLGIPGLLQTLMLNGYNKTLKIYGPEGTKRMMQLYVGLFAHRGDNFQIEVHEVEKKIVIDEKEFSIESEKMDHDTPARAYSFIIKEKSRIDKEKLKKLKIENSPLIGQLAAGKTVTIAGKKIDGKKLIYKEEGRKITFIMDTRMNKEATSFAKDSTLLVCESTYAADEEEIAKEHGHLTSTQAGEIAKKSNSKKLILTHLSQRYETKAQSKQILDEAKKVFKNSEIAEDLMSLEL
ncbi:MAG: ribonuclease Z, partial [archaeon]